MPLPQEHAVFVTFDEEWQPRPLCAVKKFTLNRSKLIAANIAPVFSELSAEAFPKRQNKKWWGLAAAITLLLVLSFFGLRDLSHIDDRSAPTATVLSYLAAVKSRDYEQAVTYWGGRSGYGALTSGKCFTAIFRFCRFILRALSAGISMRTHA